MHAALEELIQANDDMVRLEAALEKAKERRRQCALGLQRIQDETERWDAALYAYSKFGEGLSLCLAEAVTGLPGRRSQSTFLERAGRWTRQPKGRVWASEDREVRPAPEWPNPTALERELIEAHIAHGTPYTVDEGLGWVNLRTSLTPTEAQAYLHDPVATLAKHFGLQREEFLEWLTSYGSVQCDGHTQTGERCKSNVAGVATQMPIERWAKARSHGGYCRRHGGG